MRLMRPAARRVRVTLVPLIDVLFILLVYFMVTSVYLDLDMIPLSRTEAPVADVLSNKPAFGVQLLRIDATDRVLFRGRVLEPGALSDLAQSEEWAEVMILPSPGSKVQSLASLLDGLAQAGVTQSRIVRLEGRP